MIFVWIAWLCRAALRLIVPPPKSDPLPVIDRNAACPCCGHRDGTLKCHAGSEVVVSHESKTPKLQIKPGDVLVQHTCAVCGAKWFEKTVYQTMFSKRPEVIA